MTTLPARKAHKLSTAAWDLDARVPAGRGRGVCEILPDLEGNGDPGLPLYCEL
jgi:hypothetical protein